MSYHLSNDAGDPTAFPGNPYNNPNKRRNTSGDDGRPSPNEATRLDQGFQSFQGTYDGRGVQSDSSNSAGSILPGVTLPAHTIFPGDGLFSLTNEIGDKPLLRKLVNELIAQYAQMWPGQTAMIMLALEQALVPHGAASEYKRVTPEQPTPEVGIKYMGLHTIEVLGNVHCGKRMRWAIRPFGPDLTSNTHGQGEVIGEYANAYGLYLTPVNSQTLGAKFNKAVSELINNSSTWENALANQPGMAAPWTAAAFALFRSHSFAGIAMVERLLRFGVISVNNGANMVNNVVRDAAGNVRLPNELVPAAGAPAATLDSWEVAARLADYMGVTAPTDTLVGTLDANATQFYAEFAHQYAESLYYTSNIQTGGSLAGGLNAAVEFGAEFLPSGPFFFGRNRDTTIKTDRIGSVTQLQLVHSQQAVSAFAHAVDADEKWLAGTCLSGSTGGKAVIMLHK